MPCFRIAAAALFVGAIASTTWAGPVYFLVTELPGQEAHHDSYVLPLEDQADIAHARDLIARGPEAAGAPIAVAEILAGADGINRDELAAGKPLWNWHVTAFEGFADTTVEILDGWPSSVAQDVQGWIANTNSRIGFWNYTVIRELGPSSVPIPLPAPLVAGAILCVVACPSIALRIARARRLSHF